MKLNPYDPVHRDIKLHLDHLRTAASERIANYARSLLYVLLGISALTYASTANARDLAWMPNDAGGEIVLTDIPAMDCQNAHIVVARAVTGRTLVGCYAVTETGYIAARFGDRRTVWRAEDFRLFDAPTSRPAVREFGL